MTRRRYRAAAAAFVPSAGAGILQIVQGIAPEKLQAWPSGLGAGAVAALKAGIVPDVNAAILTTLAGLILLVWLTMWGIIRKPVKA